MKKLIFAIMLVLTSTFTLNAMEHENDLNSLSCSGNAQIAGAWATLNCINGNCSGWLSSQYLSANGSCDSSGSFRASGYLNSVFITGSCNGSFISIFTPSENINLTGTCDNNGSFNGNMYLNGSFISGSCQTNGTSSIYLPGSFASVNGSCSN